MSTTDQAGLFDTLPYQPHSAPSRSAAEAKRPTAKGDRERILALLTGKLGGLTDEEIARTLGMNPSTARPRRIELVGRGQVRDSGTKRPGASGCAMAVWEAT